MRHRRFLLITAAVTLSAAMPGLADARVDGARSAGPGATITTVQTGAAPFPLDASAYAAGACVVLPPTVGNRHQVVFLDAGGGAVPAVRASGTAAGRSSTRANLALRVVQDAAQTLRARGFTVVASRGGAGLVARLSPADTAAGRLTRRGLHRDLAARGRCANRSHASVLVSVQFGAAGASGVSDPSSRYEGLRPFAEQNLALAQLVQGDVTRELAARGWGGAPGGFVQVTAPAGPAAATDSTFMLLGPRAGFNPSPTTMPGTLIEPLSLGNASAERIAASRSGQAAIADGLVKAISEFLPPPVPYPLNKLKASFPGEQNYAESVLGKVPLARVWLVPAAGPGQGDVTVASFDPTRTRLVLHAGSVEPGAAAPLLNGPQVGPDERRQLVAAFNAGFKARDARGGWYSEGQTVGALAPGAASVVIYADGGVNIGSWGSEVPAPGRVVASVRQNLQMLIDDGQPKLQYATSVYQLEQWWGFTFANASLVSRSALGVTANGTLVWAAGTDVSIPALTDALLAHGAVRAMQLDINAPLVRGFLYPGVGRITATTDAASNPALPLVIGQDQTPLDFTASGSGASSVPHCTYITTCARDFFTVITRS